MRRRDFITGIAGSAVAWPLAARAQQADRMRKIGVLMGWPESDPEAQSERAAFIHELQKLGWADGRNLRIDTRWAAPADPESMHRLAKQLVALQPDLILSQSTPATTALLQETRTIPVIFGIVADPIGSGFVASFPRPGGNATDFAVAEPTQAAKWAELLKEIAPQVTRVAVLFNPAMATFAEFWLKPFKAAAPSFAVEVILAPVHDPSELESVIATQAREPNSGLFVMPDAFTITYRVEVTSLTARYRLPAVYGYRFFAELGGLLSYGEDLTDNFRSHPEGRKAERASRPGPCQVRVGNQPQDCQSARPNHSFVITRHGRRGHRITTPFTAAQNVCFWHKADMAIALHDVRFSGKANIIHMEPT